MTEQAVRRINWLLERYEDPRYLEIGVFKGITFNSIQAHSKVAVDPKFHFDRPSHSPGTEFHETTSDVYFANIANDSVFDVIFLDGLHTFEQTLRDFCNSISHIHENSIIIIDDTIPSDPYSAIRDQRRAIKHRESHGGKSRSWHGDTYKVVFAIHDFFPSFSYATVMDDGNPQTIVWKKSRNCCPEFDLIEEISRSDYFEFRDRISLFNPVTNAELMNIIPGQNQARSTPSR